MNETDKLRFYNATAEVPREAKKPIGGGRLKGMTDINPMWRIKKLTEVFGPCGFGWWYRITEQQIARDEHTKQAAAFVNVELFVRDPESGEVSQPIPGTGGAAFLAAEKSGIYLDDEAFKKATTDAISVAAKALGVGASVYWERDPDKYSSEPAAPKEKPKAPEYICECCGGVIAPYRDGAGKPVNLAKHAERSLEKYGKLLCLDCIAARARAQELNNGQELLF